MGQLLEDDDQNLFQLRGIYAPWSDHHLLSGKSSPYFFGLVGLSIFFRGNWLSSFAGMKNHSFFWMYYSTWNKFRIFSVTESMRFSVFFWYQGLLPLQTCQQKMKQKTDVISKELHMGVSKNRGIPKSSTLIWFSMIFTIHFWATPIFGNTHMWTHLWSEFFMVTVSRPPGLGS